MREFKMLLRQDLVEYIWHLDLSRPKKCVDRITIWDYFLVKLKYPVFNFLKCLRLCNALSQKKVWFPLFVLERIRFRYMQNKFGIQTGYKFSPGGGFFIGHYGGIVIHQDTKIGKNFILHQNTTIGTNDRGVPSIGDNVRCGANVCIIGDVSVGNNCRIGAGAVVVKSFEAGMLIVGNPAHAKYTNIGEG